MNSLNNAYNNQQIQNLDKGSMMFISNILRSIYKLSIKHGIVTLFIFCSILKTPSQAYATDPCLESFHFYYSGVTSGLIGPTCIYAGIDTLNTGNMICGHAAIWGTAATGIGAGCLCWAGYVGYRFFTATSQENEVQQEIDLYFQHILVSSVLPIEQPQETTHLELRTHNTMTPDQGPNPFLCCKELPHKEITKSDHDSDRDTETETNDGSPSP